MSDERATFEKWAQENGFDNLAWSDGGDCYIWPPANYAWAAWKGRKAIAAQTAQAVPAGYKLVPVEPTAEMLRAYRDFIERGEHFKDLSIYKAILDAAPPQAIAAATDAPTYYAISLQRAIEHHCRGLEVPSHIADECPHHAKMLNARLAAPAQGEKQ